MSIAVHTRLGPYEILGLVGAGGMGEVYRARHARLGWEVAIKVLPPALANHPERLRRFEQEARATGALNHPNILVVHDFDSQEGVFYLVSELLEGETLREKLAGPGLAPRRALGYAVQIARGLAAAHAKGITHRDLKPENIFVTRDGTVKILDFGLAKLASPQLTPSEIDNAPTAPPQTEPGVVMGTAGYMSPEQVRGQPADHRADLFSLGAVLYEMLSGRRAFRGGSAVETMNAILKEAPPELPVNLPGVSNRAMLDRTVRRLMEKDPQDRLESARDLAFALESLAESAGAQAPPAPARRRFRFALIVTAITCALAVAAFVLGTRLAPRSVPSLQRLTFRRGVVSGARFTRDGNTIVYSAAWDGARFQLFSTRPDSPESRSLGISDALILAISRQGQMAICFPTMIQSIYAFSGTLARAPVAGGGPHEIAENVSSADWSPDGASLAVIRVEDGRYRLEYPMGKVLYQTAGYLADVRVSPRGDRVAFLDHPLQNDAAGFVAVVDTKANKKTLSSRYNSSRGLAWSADGSEVWFSAASKGSNLTLCAVALSGRERVVARFPGYANIEDVSRDGRVLLSVHRLSASMVYQPGTRPSAPGSGEVDLCWHDQSQVADISGDGKTILFAESGEATGADYEAYLRRTDGGLAVRLGVGLPEALSQDGKWVIANPSGFPAQLVLLPAGPGDPRPLTADSLHHVAAAWLPGGKQFVFVGSEPGRRPRYYVQGLDHSPPRPVTGEDIAFDRQSAIAVSPDGQFVAVLGSEQQIKLYPVSGGNPRLIPNLDPGYVPLRWCDGDYLIVHRSGDLSAAKLWKVDLKTGALTLWKELRPANQIGLLGLAPIRVSPDCRSCAYSPLNAQSDVYLVEKPR